MERQPGARPRGGKVFLETILVPVEEGPEATAALSTALELAIRAELPVRIDGLYVVGVSARTGHLLKDLGSLMGFEPVLVPEDVERWHQQRGEQLMATTATRFQEAGLVLVPHLELGAVGSSLLHHAASAELVVVGVGPEGTVCIAGPGPIPVERFLKRVDTTVIVVGARPLALSGITLGFDGSDGARCALRSARRLAGLVGCPVQVVFAQEAGRGGVSEKCLAEAVSELEGIEVEARAFQGEAVEVLLSAAQQKGHDLLAVGYRGRSTLKGRVLGRVTDRLLEESSVGLMISR